jgi:hypothetical protein
MNKSKVAVFYVIITCILFTGLCNPLFAQRKTKSSIGYGGSIIYNFATAGFGADLRVKIPLHNWFSLVPEVSYFPAFNPYHEIYAGMALHYEIFSIGSYNLYLAAGGYYNYWINADDFAPGQKKQNNFAPEAGGGLVRNRGCIRPFIEDRYDFKWKEDNIRIGIYFYPGSCGNRKEKCPPSAS